MQPRVHFDTVSAAAALSSPRVTLLCPCLKHHKPFANSGYPGFAGSKRPLITPPNTRPTFAPGVIALWPCLKEANRCRRFHHGRSSAGFAELLPAGLGPGQRALVVLLHPAQSRGHLTRLFSILARLLRVRSEEAVDSLSPI